MGGRFSSLLLYKELQDVVRVFARSERIAFTHLTSNKMEDVSPIISSAKHLILGYFHFHLKYICVDKFTQPNFRTSRNVSTTNFNCCSVRGEKPTKRDLLSRGH